MHVWESVIKSDDREIVQGSTNTVGFCLCVLPLHGRLSLTVCALYIFIPHSYSFLCSKPVLILSEVQGTPLRPACQTHCGSIRRCRSSAHTALPWARPAARRTAPSLPAKMCSFRECRASSNEQRGYPRQELGM